MSAIAETPRVVPTPAVPRLVHRKGITRIALVGPDGVGKSTVIELLRESLRHDLPWLAVAVRQWRPGLLPNLRDLASGQRTLADHRPRRTPGRFRLLRLAWYLIDYLVGSFWKDWIRCPETALIVYDRCALDMQVDPVRFALSSTAGTKLLWRITPKPDLVILLEDDPQRILQRKQELAAFEMEQQQAEWRRLSELGVVHAAIRVDAGAEEIAGRVRQLALDALSRRHAERVPARDTVAWLRETVLGSSGPAVRAFIPVPSRGGMRVLIPATPRKVAAQALSLYSTQRASAHLARTAMRAGLRAGVGQLLLRDRVLLPTAGLEQCLREVTGDERALVAIAPGTAGPRRKPTFQVMSAAGEVLAYAKQGCNRVTNALVRNEADTLRLLAGRTFNTAIVPRLLGLTSIGGSPIVILKAADCGRSPAPRLDGRHLEFLTELAHVECGRSAAPLPERLRMAEDAMRRADFPWYASLMNRARDFVRPRLAGTPTFFTHGDFAPWNIRESNGRLLIYDWEDAGPGLPAADLFCFVVSTEVELRHHDGSRIFRALMSGETRTTIQRYLNRTGCAEESYLPLLAAWSAETLAANAMLHGHRAAGKDLAARRALASVLLLTLNRTGECS
jgi:hypothetical protein